mmetsp:Transcript_26489/g.58212  ORF Transcript_26489/g.58212 Transcript_26489/m.58212 type:complete len:126 (-) Transcript_26489:153-530(-)|eukprot:CAMPEP_0170611214 /NCGR_PEP_ID=MMETSP0224-20130122/23071_1 /TAXON_ID=285029 /ORGANISM="Togula jolla, Strain CCCM 725" /LENGTH=125 /DNA_ID=CAMNT_0010936637 /DNA_START=52 /DNA_END=429 /DNA_ORIENTATION=-
MANETDPVRELLRKRSVKELKEMLRLEGYDPDQISGIEKEELVERLWLLQQNPVEEDEYPLPLYSNCLPQVVLRGMLVAGVEAFALSYWTSWRNVFLIVLLTAIGLVVRNILIRKNKSEKLRKRQ